MWYHQDGRYGAGLYPAGTEVRLTNKFVSLLTPPWQGDVAMAPLMPASEPEPSPLCEGSSLSVPLAPGEPAFVSVQPLELTAGTEVTNKYVSLSAAPTQGDVRMSPTKPIAEPQREKEKSPLQKSTFQANPQAPNSAATNRVVCEFTREEFIVKDVAVQPLELTVPFLRGKSKLRAKFDCRFEKCLELFDVSIGQKFIRDNGKVTTVFGMAYSGSGAASTIKLFFREDGAEYVGAYHVDAMLTFFYPPEDDFLD